MYCMCEIITRSKGYPEDVPLNECSGKIEKSIFLNGVKEMIKKVNILSERSSENIKKVNTKTISIDTRK